MAARSLWNGAIGFGLVTVPVKVHSATESKSVHFREVHLPDGAKIEHRLVCPEHGKEVSRDEVVKGFEVRQGEFVELTKDEIAAAAGERTRFIDVEHFVPGEDIDPVFYEKTYYLGAGEKGEDAYTLLHAALAKSGRVAIGRWTFHDRERLVAIRPLDGVLGMHVMRFHDEVVEAGELELPGGGRKPNPREVEMAGKLVKSLLTKFKPAEYEDTYREAVLEVVERKAKGEAIEPIEDPKFGGDGDDLLAALEASV